MDTQSEEGPTKRPRQRWTCGEAEELKEEDLSEAARQALRLKAADAFGVTREVQKQLLAGEGGRILRGLFHRFC